MCTNSTLTTLGRLQPKQVEEITGKAGVCIEFGVVSEI